VEAKQHLASRSAVEEDESGVSLAIVCAGWQEELPVEFETI
jgi:hypothetical protein